MSIDKIISEIEEQSSMVNIDPLFEDKINFTNEVIDIIRKHTEGMVLVPEGDLQRLSSHFNAIAEYSEDSEIDKAVLAATNKIKAMLQASKGGE